MAEIRVNATGAVKFYDNDDSNFVGLQAGSISSDVTFTLPTADGSNGQFMKTDGSGALSFGSVSSAADDISTGDAAVTLATSAGNITVDAQGNDTDIIFKGTDGGADTTFLTIDGSDAGTLIANHNLELGTDASEILFGADNEVKVIHNADKGLILKHTATADDKPVILTLQTGETDMAANDVIGKIEFQAPDESTGTDAILVSGAIQAVAEGDHSSSSNATRLEFMTGASEAATAKMTLSSAGLLTVTGGITMTGTTPTLTIGDAGAEDAKIVFDGNAQDYHIGLDDSLDSFVIGNNGFSTQCIVINDSAIVTIPNQPSSLYTASANSNFSGDGTEVTLGQTAGAGLTENFDVNGDSVDGIFTAPVTGKYLIVGQVWINDIGGSHNDILIKMETSNRTYYIAINPHELGRGGDASLGMPICALADMDANDTHILKVSVHGSSKSIDYNSLSTLGIQLLS